MTNNQVSSLGQEIGSDVEIQASSLLYNGKRHLILKDIPSAVSDLSEACELLSQKFGDTAEECAEAFLYYGKSLLELSRLESSVLCNALEGVDLNMESTVDENESDECSVVEGIDKLSAQEKSDVEEKVTEALEENFEQFDRLAKIHFLEYAEDDSEDEAISEDAVEENSELPKNEESEEEGKVAEENLNEEIETAEDTDDLQLSWEVVDLARATFQKIAEKSIGDKKTWAEAKYCEALLVLGEIGLENENYAQSMEDLIICVEKRKTLAVDNRAIAEAYYQLGVAQWFLKKCGPAEASFKNAMDVLKFQIGNVRKAEASGDSDREVTDLESLVGEIQNRIEELKTEDRCNMNTKFEEGAESVKDVVEPVAI